MIEYAVEPSSIKSQLEQLGASGVEVARSGRILALRCNVDTDLITGTPTLSWIEGIEKPINSYLQTIKLQKVASVDIASKQGLPWNLDARLGASGHFALWLLPDEFRQKSDWVNSHTLNESSDGLTGLLQPPFTNMSKFIEEFAQCANYALNRYGPDNIQLQTVPDFWQAKLNITLIVSRKTS